MFLDRLMVPRLLTPSASSVLVFFLNDPATPEISPLPLHAALPIWGRRGPRARPPRRRRACRGRGGAGHLVLGDRQLDLGEPLAVRPLELRLRLRQRAYGEWLADRKSTRLNSSH